MSEPAFWAALAPSATVLSGYATAIGVLIGGVSAILIAIQITSSGRISRLTTALEAHQDYIQLCVEMPEMSSSDMMLRHLKRKNFDGILNEQGSIETERALWFVSFVLHAMEQMLISTTSVIGPDPTWQTRVHAQLGYHRALLEAVWPDWEEQYSSIMRRHVAEVLGRPAA